MTYINSTAEVRRKDMYSKVGIFSDDRIKRDLREVYSTKEERDHLSWEHCPIEDKQHLLDAYGITLDKLNELLATVEKVNVTESL